MRNAKISREANGFYRERMPAWHVMPFPPREGGAPPARRVADLSIQMSKEQLPLAWL